MTQEPEWRKEKRELAEKYKDFDYNQRKPLNISVDDLTEKEHEYLIESNTFCILPWIHLHAYPDGKAYPCCLATYDNHVGNLRDNTIEEVWRDKPMQTMRENMLADKPCKECTKCYEQEKTGFFSMRNSSNRTFGHHIKEVMHSDEFKLRYYDIRFSNLCNMSCRSCGDIFSSKWTQEYKQYGWLPKDAPNVTYAGRYKTDIWEQTLPHIPYMQEVYFAGGEPLMMQEHWDLLDELLKQGRTDVKLVYNTNFSETIFKGRDVFEIWKEFDEVSIGASLDASYGRGELMRKGTDWAKIVENRKRMLEICPDVDFYVSSTLSIMNVFHLPDFHKEWIELGLLEPMDWNINILQSPEYMRIDVLPQEMKQEISKLYQQHCAWLDDKDRFKRAITGFHSARNYMTLQDNSNLIPELLVQLDKLDKLRGEDFFSVFPELEGLKKYA